MKKLLMSAAVLAMALASCQNEEIVSQADGMVSVKAIMGMGSRTTVSEDGTVAWSQGDKMLVYGGKTQGVLTLEGEGGDATGTFTGFVQGAVAELTTALYPAEMADADGNITLSQITYPNSNSPMVATWGESLNFSHLAGLVRVSVTGLTAETNTLSITGVGIAGTATLSNGELTGFSTEEETITVKGIPAGNHVIDVPVFASETLTDATLSISVNGGEAATIETSLKIGAAQCLYLANGENGLEIIDDVYIGWYDEEETKFTLRTAKDLKGLAALVNSGTDNFAEKTIELTDNIDLKDMEWLPIGTSDKKFAGTFDGNEKTISNMTIDSESYPVAFFGEVAGNTVVKNVIFENVNVKSSGYAAAVVGYAEEGIVIENVKVEGKVESGFSASGIGCWLIDAKIKNVINRAAVTGSNRAGGIAGNFKGEIENAVNYGNVTSTGGMPAGGIVGVLSGATTFKYCFNYGNVTTTANNANSSAAGILGHTPNSKAEFNYCANYGEIKAEGASAAGIAVCLYGNVTANYCYNAGTIQASTFAGGIAPKGIFSGDAAASCCVNGGKVTGADTKVYQAGSKNTDCYYLDGEVLKKVGGEESKAEEALTILNGGEDTDFFTLENGKIVVK